MKDIIHVHVIKSTASMKASKIKELYERHSDKLPDDECFLTNLDDSVDFVDDNVCSVDGCDTENDRDAKYCKECGSKLPVNGDEITLTNLAWNGYESGKTFHSCFVKQIVPHINGHVEAVALLAGDEESPPKLLGILIDDGEYTKCDVDINLIIAHSDR